MVTDINAGDWNDKIANVDKPVFVDYWHEQCVWCNRLAPLYEELSSEFSNADFVKINIRANNENLALAQESGIMSTPTIKLFCGGREVGETIGYMDKPELKEELVRLLGSSESCLQQSNAA